MKFEMIFVMVLTAGFIHYCKSCSEETKDGSCSKPEYDPGKDLCNSLEELGKLNVSYSVSIGSVSCGEEKQLNDFDDKSPSSVVFSSSDDSQEVR